MSGYNQRLKEFIEFNKISPPDFYKGIGASRMEFSSWIHMNKPIPLNKIIAILERYPGMNSRWLLTGYGIMQRDYVAPQEEKSPEPCPLCHDKQIQLDQLRELYNEKQQLVDQYRENQKVLMEYNGTLKERIQDLQTICNHKQTSL